MDVDPELRVATKMDPWVALPQPRSSGRPAPSPTQRPHRTVPLETSTRTMTL
jgi:hypothetical protein